MKDFFQKYGLIILLVAVIFAGTIWAVKNYNNVAFDFSINDNPSGILKLLTSRYALMQDNQIQKTEGLHIDIPLTTTIKNNKSSVLDFKNLFGSISYNNQPIIQTNKDSSVLKDVQVPAKGSTPVTDKVQVLINMATIDYFTELVKGNKPKADYNINATLFGEPYNFKSSTSINQA